MIKTIVATVILLLTGCVNTPMTTILVPTERGVVTIKAPKDSKIENLKADFAKGTVSLEHYEARMNPDVISASATGQAELIKAYGELANNMAQMGLRMFAASQGIPLPPPAPTPQPTNNPVAK